MPSFAGRINHDGYLGSTGYGFAVNPGDIGRSLCPLLADANLGGVARYTQIADIDIVAPAGEMAPALLPIPMLLEPLLFTSA